MEKLETVVTHYVNVRYVTIGGAGGATPMELTKVPQWLADNPGTLIIALDVRYTKTYGV